MDARQYFLQHGEGTCTQVAERAKTNWPYFKQFVYGHRKPSPKLARKLVSASVAVTPGESLTFEKLLFPPPRKTRGEREAQARPQPAARRCG